MAQMTNADRIRSMTDKQLAERLQEWYCPPDGINKPCSEDCTTCWLRWLQKPVDGIFLEELCSKSEIDLWENENDV